MDGNAQLIRRPINVGVQVAPVLRPFVFEKMDRLAPDAQQRFAVARAGVLVVLLRVEQRVTEIVVDAHLCRKHLFFHGHALDLAVQLAQAAVEVADALALFLELGVGGVLVRQIRRHDLIERVAVQLDALAADAPHAVVWEAHDGVLPGLQKLAVSLAALQRAPKAFAALRRAARDRVRKLLHALVHQLHQPVRPIAANTDGQAVHALLDGGRLDIPLAVALALISKEKRDDKERDDG